MSKFCTSCGSQGDDNAIVCPNCGNPFDNVNNQNQIPQPTAMPNYGGMPQANEMPNYGGMPNNDYMSQQNSMPFGGNMSSNTMPYDNNMTPQSTMPNVGAMQMNNKKKLTAFCVVGVALLLVVAIARVALSGSSYEKVIEQKLKAIEKLDAEKLTETYPEFMYYEDCETFEDAVKDVEDNVLPDLEECIEELEDEAGKNIKFSYKLDSVTDLSEGKFDKFCTGVEYYHDYDVKGIKEIKKATVTVTAKGDKGKYEFDWKDVYLIKENGNWYIMNTDFEFASFDDNDYLHIDYYEYYKEEALAIDEELEEGDEGDLLY